METKHTIETIKETYVLGISGIIRILGFKRSFFSTWVEICSAIFSLLLLVFCFAVGVNPFDIILDIKTLMINFLPSIIGFTLAGYSLVIGFVQAGMLNKITEPLEKDIDNFSLYQKMSAAFAMNIILQTITLVIAFIVHLIIFIDEKKQNITFFDNYILFVNWLGLLIISYSFFLSLFITIQIVLNIFGFSQLHQYLINKEKLDNSKNEN